MKFTHLQEAAAFAHRAAKEAPYIGASETVPVLAQLDGALTTLHESTMRLIAAYGQAISSKGSLNEKQYPTRLEVARHNADALRKLKREQMAARCRYESGRIVIHSTRNQVSDNISLVEAAIASVLAFADSLGKSESDLLIREVCESNCIEARKRIVANREVWQKASDEVCSYSADVTRGLARQAISDAFSELSKNEANRMLLLWNDDLLFAENLAQSVVNDAELAALLIDFQRKFADAWEKLHVAKFERSHLQTNRGTLNEDQYRIKIERADGEEFDRLYTAQQHLRQAHYGCMVSLRWLVSQALSAAEALAPVYVQVRDLLLNDSKHAGNQLSNRVMACRGGELIVFAVINNCVAAEALIRDTCGRKAKEFADELARDITDGQAKAANDEALAKLKGHDQKQA